jgi:23S rRNA (uracil1939-C5)-methyltransferase
MDLFTAPVERIAAGGDGILRYRDRILFIGRTAPGDLVVGRITDEKRGRAELVELAEPSPLRQDPRCPLYGTCGGCSLQHLSYEAQVTEKTLILKDALRRIGGIDPPEPRVRPSPPWEYRNRFEFHRINRWNSNPEFHRVKRWSSNSEFRPIKRRCESDGLRRAGAMAVGLKGRKSGAVVALGDCPVADPAIRGALREGRIVPPPEKDRFSVYGRGNILLGEGEKGRISLLQRELILDGGVFFQSNGILLEALIGDLQAAARKVDPALPGADIYCGVGTFALFLGDHFSRLDLVEENKTALALARENMALGAGARRKNAGTDIRYFAMTEDRWVKGRAGEHYGFAVVDPPRRGLSPSLARWLAESGPPVLAYVSCDPATLARDGRILLDSRHSGSRRRGYRLDSLGFYDFYPQTAHIESLSIFTREEKPA